MSSSRLFINKIRHTRKLYRCRIRLCSTQALEVPTADGLEKTYPAHINDIVDRISQLTLMEVADLNSCLKKRLNIPDAPMMAMGMPMGNVGQSQVKSLFTVKLDKFEDSKKIALIKEVKKLVEGMNLVQAKKFVESAPVVVKEELTKDEAEELKKALEAAGGSVVVE
ncbi:MRPL12 [Bugula neritina]|uniref:MRPL12 n=1 Tax=Bugula neritina TaxID=10212 RepID=A0A7J7K1W0_BUGNE|nr:MRPL12 [Bugula neritina]